MLIELTSHHDSNVHSRFCQQASSRVTNYLQGLLCKGIQALIMLIAPFTSPELPKPATALPMIKTFEEGATPHMSEPHSNKKRKARNVYFDSQRRVTVWREIRHTFELKYVYIFPVSGCSAELCDLLVYEHRIYSTSESDVPRQVELESLRSNKTSL